MLTLLIIACILFVALITVTTEDFVLSIKWRNEKRSLILGLSLLAEVLGALIVFIKLELFHKHVAGVVTTILIVVISLIYGYTHLSKRHAKLKLQR